MPAYGRSLARLWPLEPRLRYLNHGAFGATPKAVLAECLRWQQRIERNPSGFMHERVSAALRESAAALAGFLGTRLDRLALTENTTSAVNAVLRGFPWRRGDGILITDTTYPAVRNTALYIAASSGVRVHTVAMPMPVRDHDQVLDAWRAALVPGIRVAVLDHITSPTALVLPVARIAAMLKRRGIRVLVDGAHAPGQVPLAIDDLGVDWYAGTCHKWLFAARGTAFLWASKAAARSLHPAVISNRYGEGFPLEFDWIGTRDYAAWLALPRAISFYRGLGGARLRERNHRLALAGAGCIASALGVEMRAPRSMLAAMVALPLPPEIGHLSAEALMQTLRRRYRIEVPVIRHLRRGWVRISAQAYNDLRDYEALAEALGAICRPARR